MAKQYKSNTWKELITELAINENEDMSIEESLNEKTQVRDNFQSMQDELNCDEEKDDWCTTLKSSFKDLINWLDATIDCDTRIISKDNLEKSDIAFCIDAEEQLRDAFKNFYIIEDWECNSKCEDDLNVYEHNIKVFQDYLEKLD